jgi:hypothetical protein
MDYFTIQVEGLQFKKSYLIYVIEINHRNNGKYFYIGQTGDRNYRTARPAFRRLAAHFIDQGNSTENQVYRQIAVKILGIESAINRNKFTSDIKQKVSEFLVNSKIIMYAFPIFQYQDNVPSEEHKQNRIKVETLERIIINNFISNHGVDRILNNKIQSDIGAHTDELQEKVNNIMKITCG